MGVVSGKSGAVNTVSDVRKWMVSSQALNGPYVSSATDGVKDRIAGPEDWAGSYAAYGDIPAVLPGAAFNFLGSMNGSVGVYGTAIVEAVKVTIAIPQEEGQKIVPIHHVVAFAANGTLYRGAAVATDATVPAPLNPKDIKINFDGGADECQIYQAEFVITSENKPYRTGCSNGQTYRLAGNMDAALKYECYVDGFDDLPDEASIKLVKLYTATNRYYEVKWMIVDDLDPMEVDIEGKKNVYAGVGMSLKSVNTTRGYIKHYVGAVAQTIWS
jgi:hypothetical protein